jgi:hypothetical protein
MRRFFRDLLAYTLWALSAALSVWALFWVRKFVLVDVPAMLLGLEGWVFQAVAKFGTVLLGLLWLIVTVASEPYFARISDQDPERRLSVVEVLRVFVVELLVLGAAYGGHVLVY